MANIAQRCRILADIVRNDFDSDAAFGALSAKVTNEQLSPYIEAFWSVYPTQTLLNEDGEVSPSLAIQQANHFLHMLRQHLRETRLAALRCQRLQQAVASAVTEANDDQTIPENEA